MTTFGMASVTVNLPNELQLTLARFGNNPIVVLNVGPNKTRFDVHKRQLCELSPFFQAAFNGQFREQAGSMDLVEDDVHAFEHFVRWLYQGNVGIHLEGEIDLLRVRLRELYNVYLLADKYNVSPLKNDIMEILFDAVKADRVKSRNKGVLCPRRPRKHDMEHVYSNTVQCSPLRKFVIACYTWLVNLQCYTDGSFSDWLRRNPEIATDLAIGFASRLQGGKDPFAKGQDASVFLELSESDGGSDQT